MKLFVKSIVLGLELMCQDEKSINNKRKYFFGILEINLSLNILLCTQTILGRLYRLSYQTPHLDFRSIFESNKYKFAIIIKKSMDYLYCTCPAVGCDNKRSPSYWYHDSCGSRTLIQYSNIFIHCSGCSKKGIMFDWKFSCQDHGFRNASKQGCLYALSVLGLQRGNQDQIRQATISLMQNWPKNS